MAFTFGACFCMPSSFAGERPLELLFIKSGRLFACRRLVEGFRLRATEELFDYKMSSMAGANFYVRLPRFSIVLF